MSLDNWSRCVIESHYYKVDSPINEEDGSYYAKCQRCNIRILITDKSFEDRKTGAYKL